MRAPAAVIFDLDGTLLFLDVPIDKARHALSEFFARWGYSRPFRPILQRIKDAASLAAEQGEEYAAIEKQALGILDSFELEAARRARARKGAQELVLELVQRQIPLGLVTNNGRACVGPALRAIGLSIEDFRHFVARDDVVQPKPDPTGLIEVTGRLQGTYDDSTDYSGIDTAQGRSMREGDAEKEKASSIHLAASRATSQVRTDKRLHAHLAVIWYIGDHVSDVAAGYSAKDTLPMLKVAALRGGRCEDGALEAAGADAVLSSLEEVMRLPGL